MDNKHFDSIVKSFGTEASRRRILKGIGASALGALGLSSLRTSGLAAPCPSQNATQCGRAGGQFDASTRTCTIPATTFTGRAGCKNPRFKVSGTRTGNTFTGSGGNCQSSGGGVTTITSCTNPAGQSVDPLNEQQCC